MSLSNQQAKLAVVGGYIGVDGIRLFRLFSLNAKRANFQFTAKAIQELSETVKQQKIRIDDLKQTLL